MLRRITSVLSARVDIAWLVALRILFGAAMCVSVLRFIAYDWARALLLEPSFRFKYFGFAWVEPLSSGQMYALFWVLAALALAVAAGFCFRVAAAAFTAGFTYLQLIDVTTYLNHYYLASLLGLLLTLSPAGRGYSVDAWLRRRKAPLLHVAAGWHALFRFQIGVVYTFAGLAKAHDDWLLFAQPLSIWLGSRTGLPMVGPLLRHEWVPILASWSGFLFDTTIVWFLLWRRTRLFAYCAVIAFHVVTGVLFPIGMFPVLMVLGALVFFPADWPHQLLRRARRRATPDATSVSAPPASAPSRWATLGWALAAAYCVGQVAVPLRFLAYGGNVRWHEQGMRLSWRVMVREKNASVTFVVRSKETGRVWHVRPGDYLTRLQEREMSGQPDLILQLAHHIRDDFEARGRGRVEVRVQALASLNGRRAAPLIDPDVDLVEVEDGLGRATWILPAPASDPVRVRPI